MIFRIGVRCAVSTFFHSVDCVLSSCRSRSCIIARLSMSGASSVKSPGKLPPGFKGDIVS